jgi:hypothetical protein
MAKTNITSIDVDDHDGSTAGLYLAGTLVTPSAVELNNTLDFEYQLLVAAGAITIKNGVCKIAKTAPAAIGATLANPTTGTDDFKRLVIINFQAQLNTVTVTGGFGNGGAGEDVCTFGAAIGDNLSLLAYGGLWYVIGNTGGTIT